VYDLSLGIAQVLDGKGDGTLHAIQVVVDAQSLQDEEGCCDTTQTQLRREVLLKEILDEFDALLRLLRIEQRIIVQGFDDLSHVKAYSDFACKDITFIAYLQAKPELFLQNDTNS
jgi:hypothetical protein